MHASIERDASTERLINLHLALPFQSLTLVSIAQCCILVLQLQSSAGLGREHCGVNLYVESLLRRRRLLA